MHVGGEATIKVEEGYCVLERHGFCRVAGDSTCWGLAYVSASEHSKAEAKAYGQEGS